MSIDRWYIGNDPKSSTTLKILSYGIEITNNNPELGVPYLQHRVDPKRIEIGAYYTFAYCFADGTIKINHLTPDWVKIQIDTWGFVPATIGAGSGVTGVLKWAALYKGKYTLEDLPPYIPKTYSEELLECQRYYFNRSTDGAWMPAVCPYASGAILINLIVQKMRVGPSLDAHLSFFDDTGAWTNIESAAIGETALGYVLTLNLNRLNASFTEGKSYLVTGRLALSADL